MKNLISKFMTNFKNIKVLCILIFLSFFLLKNLDLRAGLFNPGVHPSQKQTGEILNKEEFGIELLCLLPAFADNYTEGRPGFDRSLFPPANFSFSWGLGNKWQWSLDTGMFLAPLPSVSFTKQLLNEQNFIPATTLTGGVGWVPFIAGFSVFSTLGIGKHLPFSIFSMFPFIKEKNLNDYVFLSVSSGYAKANYTGFEGGWGQTKYQADGIYIDTLLGIELAQLDLDVTNYFYGEHWSFGVKWEYYPTCYYVWGIPLSNSGLWIFMDIRGGRLL